MDNSTLGERVRNARKKLNLTQEQFGESIDVTSAYVGQIERNERTPSLRRLKEIAQKLEVSVEYLLMGTISAAKIDEDLRQELEGVNEKQKVLIIEIIKLIKEYN